MATIRLPEHSHCRFCGEPIQFGKDFCNDECQSAELERERKERLRDNLFFVACGITVLVIFGVKMLL